MKHNTPIKYFYFNRFDSGQYYLKWELDSHTYISSFDKDLRSSKKTAENILKKVKNCRLIDLTEGCPLIRLYENQPFEFAHTMRLILDPAQSQPKCTDEEKRDLFDNARRLNLRK